MLVHFVFNNLDGADYPEYTHFHWELAPGKNQFSNMQKQELWLRALLTVAGWQAAEAAAITRAGTFTQDDPFVSVSFLVDQARRVWMETISHVRGGFYPSVAVGWRCMVRKMDGDQTPRKRGGGGRNAPERRVFE
jgi:hypothetical protein